MAEKFTHKAISNGAFSTGSSPADVELTLATETKASVAVYVRSISGSNNRVAIKVKALINKISGSSKWLDFQEFVMDLNEVGDMYLTDEFSVATIKELAIDADFDNGDSFNLDVFLMVG